MKLLKNRIFAIILTAVVIVGCCAYGFFARPNETAADQTPLEYGKTNYSSYLDWIADEADLLSDDTEQLVASYMGALDHGWGSIVAVVTEDSGGADLQTRAEDWAAKGDLSGWDMILLLDAASGRWYMQPGADISPYVDQTLTTTVTACFDSRSVTEDADEILTELFPDLYTWYEDTVTAQDGISNGMQALLILVIVLLVVFGISIVIVSVCNVDSGNGGFGGPPYGRYRHHHHHHHHSGHDHGGNDRPSGGRGGFGSGGFRGGSRGGGFGSSRGFGGGRRGGGFGG